ncbi:MAG: hypothetical protein ABIA37_02270, partial [Candidatus Woesearchaeota archaeon]
MIIKKITTGFVAILLLLVSFSPLALATPEDEAILNYNLNELKISSDLLKQEFADLVSKLGSTGATKETLTSLKNLEYALAEEI